MPGPPPKPTAIKRARGNPGHKPLPKHEPEPPLDTDPDAPAKMTKAAREVWDELVPIFRDMGMWTRIDRKTFARYCELQAKWPEMLNRIKEEGYIPAADNMCKQLLRLEQEFGMTPASRTRIEVKKREGGDELEEFIAGKAQLKMVQSS